MTRTERSSVLGGRREERARSERVVVGRSMPVRQPLRMTDHRCTIGQHRDPLGLQEGRHPYSLAMYVRHGKTPARRGMLLKEKTRFRPVHSLRRDPACHILLKNHTWMVTDRLMYWLIDLLIDWLNCLFIDCCEQIHANCRIRRVYFSDRLYSEEELPAEFKLYLPVQAKGPKWPHILLCHLNLSCDQGRSGGGC